MNLPDHSTNLFQHNMLDRYLDRPNRDFKNGKYNIIDQLCFAEFLSLYYTDPKSKDCSSNDCQPTEGDDALEESNQLKQIF